MLAYVGVSLTRAAAQSIPDSTKTAMSWSTETFDTNDFRNASYPTEIVIPLGLAGIYWVYGSVQWASDAVGVRYITIERNEIEIARHYQATIGGGSLTQYIANTMICLAGDSFIFYVYQSSGGALDVERTVYTPHFGVDLLGT